ncbi:hypothetical protein [Streptomyces sp. NBC_00078]|uniref:hypothetical protein n=1 Tax=unclassified Streptomyces TaxID=2593676 RepID=UPI002259965B|nr:hypothetical protein [Streptomyces sp. NBC_00078]MCX5418143.1 hypothetical protein [Streptomyces sp. NBC_00078]
MTEAARTCALHELPAPGSRRGRTPRSAGQHAARPFHPDNPLTETREQTMTKPPAELFDAIRRDHRAGERLLPRSLAERHGVDRQTVMEAISTVPPMELDARPQCSADIAITANDRCLLGKVQRATCCRA